MAEGAHPRACMGPDHRSDGGDVHFRLGTRLKDQVLQLPGVAEAVPVSDEDQSALSWIKALPEAVHLRLLLNFQVQ